MGGWTSPNAPLSTLLPGTTSYQGTLQPGVSSGSKQQYLTDVLGTAGTNALQSGSKVLGPSLDYWQNLLKQPTRQSILERVGPAVSSVVSQYDVGKRQVSQQPRGGGTSATLANLPFQESGAITGLLETELRQVQDVLGPEAATQIGDIGKFIDTLGLSELGLSSESLSSLIQAQLTRRGQNLGIIGDVISSLGFAGGMLLGKT